MNVTEKLNEIFCEVFDDETLQIRPEMTANEVDGWDSLSHMNLIVAVENKFNIKFTQKELLTFKNIGDLLDNIASKIGS